MRDNEFFKNKKILVIGHTGFIGSWLTKWLLMLKANILGYSLDPPTNPNMYDTINISKYIKDVRSDIRDVKSLRSTIYKFQPEIVFHLAAQPIVLDSYRNPSETFETN
ncbi:MAG: GDP-mannose 4,6-dehydratase, partial [Thermoplasmata archaeon]